MRARSFVRFSYEVKPAVGRKAFFVGCHCFPGRCQTVIVVRGRMYGGSPFLRIPSDFIAGAAGAAGAESDLASVDIAHQCLCSVVLAVSLEMNCRRRGDPKFSAGRTMVGTARGRR
jgi:hypothetical protein